VRFTSYLQAAKRDCRMFVGLESMARRLERLEMIASEVQNLRRVSVAKPQAPLGSRHSE